MSFCETRRMSCSSSNLVYYTITCLLARWRSHSHEQNYREGAYIFFKTKTALNLSYNLIFTKNTAKFQINDCFENFTHEPIIFAHYLPNIFNLYCVKICKKFIYYFTPFFKKIYQNEQFSLFKHV